MVQQSGNSSLALVLKLLCQTLPLLHSIKHAMDCCLSAIMHVLHDFAKLAVTLLHAQERTHMHELGPSQSSGSAHACAHMHASACMTGESRRLSSFTTDTSSRCIACAGGVCTGTEWGFPAATPTLSGCILGPAGRLSRCCPPKAAAGHGSESDFPCFRGPKCHAQHPTLHASRAGGCHG